MHTLVHNFFFMHVCIPLYLSFSHQYRFFGSARKESQPKWQPRSKKFVYPIHELNQARNQMCQLMCVYGFCLIYVHGQVWSGSLSTNRVVVALWNRGNALALITAQWLDIGLPSSTMMQVRDLWEVSLSLSPLSKLNIFILLVLPQYD